MASGDDEAGAKQKDPDRTLKFLTFAVLVAQMAIAATQCRTAKVTQRAWVVPEINDVGIRIDRPTVPLTFTLVNYGKAPAYNVQSSSDWAFSADQLPGPEHLSGNSTSLIVPPSKTPPQAVTLILGAHRGPGPYGFVPDPISAEQRAEIANGQREVYIGGIISYDDAYGSGYVTRWCDVYVVGGTDFVPCDPGVGTTYVR